MLNVVDCIFQNNKKIYMEELFPTPRWREKKKWHTEKERERLHHHTKKKKNLCVYNFILGQEKKNTKRDKEQGISASRLIEEEEIYSKKNRTTAIND